MKRPQDNFEPLQTSTPASPFSVTEWATGNMKAHAIRLFWAFSAVVATTFAVSVINFATQTVLECPEGTQLVGGPPPSSFEAFCVLDQSVDQEDAIRHGPYRRWHAMSSAYKGSKLAPDVLVKGQYVRGQKAGEWVTKTRTGAVIERWIEGAPKYAMAEMEADLEFVITANVPSRQTQRRHLVLDDVVIESERAQTLGAQREALSPTQQQGRERADEMRARIHREIEAAKARHRARR